MFNHIIRITNNVQNPFYEIEMPIRCELFDENLTAASTKFMQDPTKFVEAQKQPTS